MESICLDIFSDFQVLLAFENQLADTCLGTQFPQERTACYLKREINAFKGVKREELNINHTTKISVY